MAGSPNPKPVTYHPAALKTGQVSLCEGAGGGVYPHTHTALHAVQKKKKKNPPPLHSLIKSTHRSPITPVRGYLKSQDVYRLFPVLLTLLQGLQWGRKISPMR